MKFPFEFDIEKMQCKVPWTGAVGLLVPGCSSVTGLPVPPSFI